jgi:hypothetical protein
MVVATSPTDVTFCNYAHWLDSGFGSGFGSGSEPPTCGDPVIHVIGVDLSALSLRKTHQGTISGVAYLEGTFSDLTLHVTYQGSPRQWPVFPRFDEPPCPAPAGGWARSHDVNPDYSAVGAYRRRSPSEVIAVESLRPGPHTWVVTLASIDPARTFAALKSDYPRKLCVVRSLYTRTEVFRARKLVNTLLRRRTSASRRT